MRFLSDRNFPNKSRPAGRKPTGFTLVEAVVVMAILAILLIAGLAATRPPSDKARRVTKDQILSLIEQARNQAITSHANVMLAIAAPGALPQHPQTCAISILELADDWNPANQLPAQANLLKRWLPLESGVILLGGDGSSPLLNPLDQSLIPIEYTRRGSVSAEVYALVFNPRGRLIHPTGSALAELRIAEGTYVRSVPTPYRKGNDGAISETRIKIGRVVGRAYEIIP